MKKIITILGSTGSIGTQALEVIEKLSNKFEVLALSAGNNIELLEKQIQKFKPEQVCISNKDKVTYLQKKYPDTKILSGTEGLIELATNKKNNLILVAVSGKIGLLPTLKAIENKIDIALANKETLVMAGDIIMQKAKENNVKILPVDSEHSAIYQCAQGVNNIKSVIITASGGPFKDKTPEEIKKVSIEETLHHPKWSMGKKITVDSATLMNKGLEVIEAHHLFNLDYNNIKVVVHPQSIIHSAIECKDGSVIAQLGVPSMHIPIQFAITYPERVEGIKSGSFNFLENSKLTFEPPDFKKFPCLKLAFDAGKKGGTFPLCMNAANEEAVLAFLNKKIKFYQIFEFVKKIFDNYTGIKNPTIDEIFEEDEKIRALTRELIKKGI